MKENTYRLLAKIGSVGVFWFILEQVYNLVYPMYLVLGFDLSKWATFTKEIFSTPDGGFISFILLPILLIVLYTILILPLWYFGWKKKDNYN